MISEFFSRSARVVYVFIPRNFLSTVRARRRNDETERYRSEGKSARSRSRSRSRSLLVVPCYSRPTWLRKEIWKMHTAEDREKRGEMYRKFCTNWVFVNWCHVGQTVRRVDIAFWIFLLGDDPKDRREIDQTQDETLMKFIPHARHLFHHHSFAEIKRPPHRSDSGRH